MKKIAAHMFIAVAMVLSFLSCAQDETEEIPVGVIIPLTGSLANFDLENALDLALEEVNVSLLPDGRKIRLIFEDSESTPDGAERAYRKLIERDEVVAILGPYTSSEVKRIILFLVRTEFWFSAPPLPQVVSAPKAIFFFAVLLRSSVWCQRVSGLSERNLVTEKWPR